MRLEGVLAQMTGERDRYDAIRAGAIAKLEAAGEGLSGLDHEVLVRRLTEEALAEHFNDTIAANYAWDAVEREIRRAIERHQ